MCGAYATYTNLSAMHSPPLPGPNRRQHPRTTLHSFVYLNLGETYYGSVLNISEGGLRFRTVRPIAERGSFTFSIFEGSHRVDAIGELVWTDATQKTGGLRFTGLPKAGSRELIDNWIRPPKTPGTLTKILPRLASSGALARENSAQPQSEITRTPWFRVPSRLPQLRLPLPSRGFSSGLITGFLVSGLLACVLWFNHYRRQFGELLVRWGQDFMGQTQANPGPIPPVLPRPSETAAPAQPSGNKHSLKAESTKPKLRSQTLSLERGEQTGIEAIIVKGGVRSSHVSSVSPPPKAPLAPAVMAVPPLLPPFRTSIPSSGINAGIAPVDRATLRTETSEQRNAASISERYLEVGKFKDRQQAVDTLAQLTRWGFPATTVQKGGLWTSAYHVLVGPYSSAQQFKAARKGLAQRGLQPKAFEKGSRSLTLLSNLMLNGAELPSGEYTISWESYVSEASVKFVRNHSVVTTAEGKWVKRGTTYNSDAYVYRRSSDDSKDLIQILFRDMSRSLDFSQ